MKFPPLFASIKSRVAVSALVVILISLWLLSLLTTRFLEQDIGQLVADAQTSAAAQMAVQINRELNNRMSSLERIAGLIDENLLENPPALQTMLNQRFLLQDLFNVSVLALNKDGISIADLPLQPDRIGIDYRVRVDAYATVFDEGRATIGQPMMGVTTGQPLIAMAVPIRNQAGQVIGALGGAIDLSRPNFLDDLIAHGYGRTGIYSIVSKSTRTVVTSSDRRLIMVELPEAGVNSLVDRAIAGAEGTEIYTSALGMETLATVKGITAADWFVVVMTPVAEAFAPINEMRQRMTLITLIVTLFFGVVIWWLLQRQLKPMLSTVEALADMTQSDRLPAPLPLTISTEVDNLITAFNRLLERLAVREEENRRFKTIADNAVYGKAIATLEGDLVYINRFFADLHGYAPAELIGRNFNILHPPHRQQGVKEMVDAMVHQGYFAPREVWRLHRDGTEFPVLMSGVLIRDEHGNPECLAVTAVDITEGKAAELALQQKNDELEQFVYIVSHDLKSPLVTINTFVGMLQQDIKNVDEEQIASDLDFIKEATSKIESLLNALLRLSRVGRMDAPAQTQAVKQQVDGCLKILAGLLQQRQTEVVVGELPYQWHGDPLHFGQIWQNLIENAVKYMGEQPQPRIEIGAEDRDEGVVFYVRDNGIGIAPEHRQRIFNIFAQLNRNSEGTGLGLALVKKIVTNYQGSVWVESDGVGQGSCFCFTLPQALNASSASSTRPSERNTI